MGACTVTVTEYYVEGNHQVRRGQLTMSNNYAAGGDTLTPSQMGLSNFAHLFLRGSNEGAGSTQDGYLIAPNPVGATSSFNATQLIQAFGDGGNSPGGPLIEAAPGSNLSGVATGFVVWGY